MQGGFLVFWKGLSLFTLNKSGLTGNALNGVSLYGS